MILRERYEIGQRLGESVFARTFAGRDLVAGGEVVVKELVVRGLGGWKPVELLEREATVLRELAHPGVPRFVDAFQDEREGEGTVMVLVVERVPGQTLAELIQSGHRWEEAAARKLLQELLGTLVYLHGLSPPVVHRDIKPSNIVVRPDGRPVLVDFGSVRDLATGGSEAGLTVVGTAGYMPPEQAMGRALPASDIYALGTTMVHALTHRHPATLPRENLTLCFRDEVGIPDEFADVLERMIDPDLKQRYARAREVLAELRGESRTPRPVLPVLVTPPPQTLPAVPDGAAMLAAVPAPPRAPTAQLERRLRFANLLRPQVRVLVGLGLTHAAGALLISGSIMLNDFSLTAATVTGALAAVLGLGLQAYIRFKEQLREVHRTGTLTEGRIGQVNYNPMQPEVTSIPYTFEVAGTAYAGVLVTGDAADLRRAVTGGPIAVIYDPERPRRHIALLPDPLAAAAPAA
jgi:serine/threonine protein kinase